MKPICDLGCERHEWKVIETRNGGFHAGLYEHYNGLQAIRRVITPESLVESILKARFVFIEQTTAEAIGVYQEVK